MPYGEYPPDSALPGTSPPRRVTLDNGRPVYFMRTTTVITLADRADALRRTNAPTPPWFRPRVLLVTLGRVLLWTAFTALAVASVTILISWWVA